MMHGNGQATVTVDRLKLIEKLKENLITHVADYKEAVIGYKVKLHEDLKDKLHEVALSSDEEALSLKPVSFNPPRSYEKEYEDAITRLEWTVGDTVQLDQTAFKQYVQNEWTWSSGFDMMATSYKAFAVGASR